MTTRLAPAGSTLDARVAAVEKELRRVAAVAAGALQIPPQARGGVPGQLLAGGLSMLDPLGLVQVLKLAAQLNGINGTTSSVTFVTIASTTLTVPLGRVQNFLCLLNLTLQASAAGGAQTTARARLNFNGQLSGQINLLTVNAAPVPYYTMSTFLTAISLPGGTYTISVECAVDLNTSTLFINDGTMNAYLMGG